MLLAAACGGSSDAPPGPLAHHFDDMYIAAIPLDQKQSVVQTQNDWSIAKMEQAKAEADLNEVATQLTIARNDQKAAHLAVDSAMSAKKSAEASADMNRVNQSQKDLHTAEDLERAAQSRVKYLETYRNYLKIYLRYTQENTYWREAQYESAKAKLAQANSIQPRGTNYADFPAQLDRRGKRTSAAKDRAEKAKQNTVAVRDTWLKIQHDADVESGRPSDLWDPMAQKAEGQAAAGAQAEPITEPKSGPTEPEGMPDNAAGAGAAAGAGSGSGAQNAGAGSGSGKTAQ